MSDETDCEAVHRAILTVAGQPTGRSALHGASDDPELQIAEALLAELGLGEMQSKQDIYHEIEKQILVPKTRLPDHWLSAYQM